MLGTHAVKLVRVHYECFCSVRAQEAALSVRQETQRYKHQMELKLRCDETYFS